MAAKRPGETARLVSGECPRSNVAEDPRSVCDLGQRDHAAADAGVDGRALFFQVLGSVSDDCGAGGVRRAGCSATVGGVGVLPAARQLHAAAKQIAAKHGGRFPRDFETVCTLPGIGRYTAGAILSIAFDQRLPILEANTIRLLSRLTAFRGDPASSIGRAHLWSAAEALLDGAGNGDVNQALMEVGSLICTPREPRCDVCPLGRLCPTRRLGLQDTIPRSHPKSKIEELREAAVILVDRGRVLLRRCGDAERWAGLWDFPRFAIGKIGGRKSEVGRKLVDGVLELTAVAIEDV